MGLGSYRWSGYWAKMNASLSATSLLKFPVLHHHRHHFHVHNVKVSLVDRYGIDGSRMTSGKAYPDSWHSYKRLTRITEDRRQVGERAVIVRLHSLDCQDPAMIAAATMSYLMARGRSLRRGPVVFEYDAHLRSKNYKELLEAWTRIERHDDNVDSGMRLLPRFPENTTRILRIQPSWYESRRWRQSSMGLGDASALRTLAMFNIHAMATMGRVQYLC